MLNNTKVWTLASLMILVKSVAIFKRDGFV